MEVSARRVRRSSAGTAVARTAAHSRWAVSRALATFNRVGLLEPGRGGPRTLVLFQTSRDLFVGGAREQKLPSRTEDVLVITVLDYVDCKHFQRVQSSLGSRLISVASYLRPELEAMPIDTCVVFGRRPSELRGLKTCLLSLPVTGGQTLQRPRTLVLPLMELGRPSRMSRWDGSRGLNLGKHQFPASMLARWRGPSTGSGRRLLRHVYPAWARSQRRARPDPSLVLLARPTLHGRWHAGASLGYARRRRTKLEIHHCVNWVAANSRRRYVKAGRRDGQLHLLAPGAHQAALPCAAEIGSILVELLPSLRRTFCRSASPWRFSPAVVAFPRLGVSRLAPPSSNST